MDLAMLAVEETPSKLGLKLLDSAGQRRLGRAAATLPGSSGFRVSPWIALSRRALHRRDEILAFFPFSPKRLQLSCFVGMAIAEGAREKAMAGWRFEEGPS
jgi:hypothetical protein